MTSSTPGKHLASMRDAAPLVQCITNYVAMNVAANVLLAAGASPAMVHSVEEAGEFAAFAGALTINMGTVSPDWADGMKSAADSAAAAGRPWVLDPVAHMATSYRRKVVTELLDLRPTVIRGNASEILALGGGNSSARGVDAGDAVAAAEDVARQLALSRQCIVAVTGRTDFVTDGTRTAHIDGGSVWMPRVTALGCSLTCLVGAYAAVEPDAFTATTAALAHFAVAGELAERDVCGPGSFAVAFLDVLASVDGRALDEKARVRLS
ncbi:hydroxyethylthiazole kinase [Ciceribacter sp. L1K22]|uniref:hydroxyethylthiazole kinase n=1 Tax=Ciceribacter sp. L1K22 TaxID=2820275 RepID=UPI001ABDBE74|nr:hydroxyethylthiazole kinase [Ciceribacter sp. L1K22]MBO3758761.1 hydroxyethylthiazole kinase [Ciceribacter sp. L1K22]